MHTIIYACVSVAVGNTVSTGHCLHQHLSSMFPSRYSIAPAYLSVWIVTFLFICELIIAYLQHAMIMLYVFRGCSHGEDVYRIDGSVDGI